MDSQNRQKIYARIKELGYTQTYIASALDIDEGGLSRFLKSDGPLAWDRIERLVTFLGGTINKRVTVKFFKKS